MSKFETDKAGHVWCAVWVKCLNIGIPALQAGILADAAKRAFIDTLSIKG